ncbi:MAG: helix-turn-helix domain-containing protein [Actinomycetota bacterium]
MAARLKELREGAGLTQTALARPRYSVSYISQIEAGRRKPSGEAMAFIAGKLGVTPAFLATGVPEDLEPSLRYQLEEARQALRDSQPGEADRILRPVLAQAEQYGLGRILASARAALGEAHLLGGSFRDAVETFEEALEGDLCDRDRGVAVGNLSRAYRAVGDLAYAADVIENHLNASDREALDPSVAADLHSVLLSVYFERGDVLRAERAAKRALAAAEQGASLYVQATTYWHASRVLAEAKRWDEALDYATRARLLMEQIEDTRRVARLHNAYAFICLEAEPPRGEDAEWHLDRAQTLLADGASMPGDLAYVFTERARIAVLRSQFDEAVTHADRALEDAQDALEIARCLFLKGRALAALARRDEASEALRRAATLFGDRGARQQEASCWREIGEMDLAAGDMESAVKALRAGLEALDPRRSRA